MPLENPIPLPILFFVCLFFITILLILFIYRLWLRYNLKRSILNNESNWHSVNVSPIEIITNNEATTAKLTVFLGESSSIIELLPSDKLWKIYVANNQEQYAALPDDQKFDVCLNGSQIVAYRINKGKIVRLSRYLTFNPSISPPNPAVVTVLSQEKRVNLAILSLAIPTGICLLFTLFTLLFY